MTLESHQEFARVEKYLHRVFLATTVIFVLLLLGFVLLLVVHFTKGCCRPSAKAYVWIMHRDRFWRSHLPAGDAEEAEAHETMKSAFGRGSTPKWLQRKRPRTFVGGLCSLLFYLLAIPTSILFVWIYLYHNETSTQALIPRSFSPDDVHSAFAFRAQFLGYSGSCAASELSSPTSPVVTVSGFELEAGSGATSSARCLPGDGNTLEVVWNASRARIATIPKVSISIAPHVGCCQ